MNYLLQLVVKIRSVEFEGDFVCIMRHAGTGRVSLGCLPARKWASGHLLAAKCKLMQITLVPNLFFYAPIAMEGAALFALFSTVFLVCRGRGQGKVYFSFSN